MSEVTQYLHPKVYAWSKDSSESKIDLSADVIGMTFSKSITDGNGFYAPSGNFSITLLPRTSTDGAASAHFLAPAHAYQVIHPQTLVTMGVDVPGGIMMGLVDAVTERFELIDSQVVRTLTLTGRDLGKVLEQDHITRAPISAQTEPQFRDDLKAELGEDFPIIDDTLELYSTEGGKVVTFVGESVTTLLQWILDRFPGMRIPALRDAFGHGGLEGDAEVRTWLDTSRCVTTWDDERVYKEARQVPEGSIIAFIQSLLDPDFYELRMDFVPVQGSPIPQPYLILRPRPFDEPPYMAAVVERPGITWADVDTLVEGLDNHRVEFGEVASASFSRSDAQAITFVQVQNANELGAGDEAVKQGLIYPIADTWGIKRHGLRAYSPRLSLVSGEPTLQQLREQGAFEKAIVPTLIEKRNRLFNWYRWNPWHESCNLTVFGKDSYRVGERVYLPWRRDYLTDTEGMEYYCTSVTHRWTYGRGYFCDLGLTRGHNGAMLSALLDRVRDESATLPTGFTKVDA